MAARFRFFPKGSIATVSEGDVIELNEYYDGDKGDRFLFCSKGGEILDERHLLILDPDKCVVLISCYYTDGCELILHKINPKDISTARRDGYGWASHAQSSELGFMYNIDKDGNITIFNPKEKYVYGKAHSQSPYPKIDIKDIFALFLREISWKDLRGRSFMHEQRVRKTLSAQERLRNFNRQNRGLKDELDVKRNEIEKLTTELKDLREQLCLCEKDSVRSLSDLKRVLPRLLCPFLF